MTTSVAMPLSLRFVRISALLYLLLGITAAFNLNVVIARVYVAGDPAATAGSVLANASLVRLGVIAELAGVTCYALLSISLYQLLGHVNRTAARAMVVLVAIGATIMCVDQILQLGALKVATTGAFAAALGDMGSKAMVLLLLELERSGSAVAGVPFGLWLLPLAFLASRSGQFPRVVSPLLVTAAGAYLVHTALRVLSPEVAVQVGPTLMALPAIGEVAMVVSLLAMAVRPRARSVAMASEAA